MWSSIRDRHSGLLVVTVLTDTSCGCGSGGERGAKVRPPFALASLRWYFVGVFIGRLEPLDGGDVLPGGDDVRQLSFKFHVELL